MHKDVQPAQGVGVDLVCKEVGGRRESVYIAGGVCGGKWFRLVLSSRCQLSAGDVWSRFWLRFKESFVGANPSKCTFAEADSETLSPT